MRHFFSAGGQQPTAGGDTATISACTARRSFAILSASALAASTLFVGMAGSADAAVAPGGGRNADGTPTYVRDAHGLAAQMCTDALNCEPGEAPDIGAYFSAEADLGPLSAGWGIEAAFLEAADGTISTRAAVSNSALFRAEGLRPNRRYTIRGPWGSHTCLSNGQGELNNKNCMFERGGEAGGPLRTGPVKSLLRARFPVRGFLGADVPQRVTGSPTGFNRVTFTGPGVNVRTNLFLITGQLADNTPMAMVNRDRLRLGSRTSTRTVTKVIRHHSVGTATARARVSKAGDNPRSFRVDNNCRSVAAGRTCAIRVSYNPGRNDRFATLVIDDNTMAKPRRVDLVGRAPRR